MSATTKLPMLSTTTRAPLQIVATQMTYYGSIVLLAVGIVGCIFNFITFTAPKLRKNSCAFYFLIAAVFELFALTFGLISRVASENLGSSLLSTSTVYCKIRAYLVSAIPLTATYLVVLSSADRCMSSSMHASLRSLSRVRIAYRATLLATIISFTSCVHILVGYRTRPRCASTPGTYAMFDSMFVVFWLGVIPHALMLLFGFATLLNIRRTKRRVAAQAPAMGTASDQRVRRTRKKDIQLMMVSNASFVQSTICSLIVLPDDARASESEFTLDCDAYGLLRSLHVISTGHGLQPFICLLYELVDHPSLLCQFRQILLRVHTVESPVSFDLRSTYEIAASKTNPTTCTRCSHREHNLHATRRRNLTDCLITVF